MKAMIKAGGFVVEPGAEGKYHDDKELSFRGESTIVSSITHIKTNSLLLQ
jgi:hypothetical protein